LVTVELWLLVVIRASLIRVQEASSVKPSRLHGEVGARRLFPAALCAFGEAASVQLELESRILQPAGRTLAVVHKGEGPKLAGRIEGALYTAHDLHRAVGRFPQDLEAFARPAGIAEADTILD
jgi:hypothetical protein